jgi:hypothetical protein
MTLRGIVHAVADLMSGQSPQSAASALTRSAA